MCKAEEVLPLPPRSKASWEMVHRHDPNTGDWAQLLVPPEEASRVRWYQTSCQEVRWLENQHWVCCCQKKHRGKQLDQRDPATVLPLRPKSLHVLLLPALHTAMRERQASPCRVQMGCPMKLTAPMGQQPPAATKGCGRKANLCCTFPRTHEDMRPVPLQRDPLPGPLTMGSLIWWRRQGCVSLSEDCAGAEPKGLRRLKLTLWCPEQLILP